MHLPNIRYRGLVKALIILPVLAVWMTVPAAAEPSTDSGTGQHAIDPAGPAKPAQAAPAPAKPAATTQTAPKPATGTATAPAAAKPATTAAETKTPAPTATKPADAKATTATAKPAGAAPGSATATAKPAGAAPGSATATAKPAGAAPGSVTATVKPPVTAPTATAPTATAPSATAPSAATATVPKPDQAPKEAAAEPEPAKPAGKPILINIDKTNQEMTVFIDGIEEHRWPVSTGMRGYSTPSGNFKPSSMNEIWYSKEWDNAPMPHAIFYMKDGHAIHGSQEVKRLGNPASHGCVRLSPKNAKTLFTLVKANGMENTQVVIDGDTPGGEAKIASQPRYQRYGEADPYGYYPPPPRYYPPQRQRRGLFGRNWFQPYGNPYAGRQGYYRQPRGYYPPY